ncbi:MAG TPA: thioredoxin domain-containing protein [Gemmatimonadales bacterium]
MNRLADEASAYLTSAAHQPVYWYPWGDAAFAAAKAGGKPILLDIGAVWCHWCHVMDGESYEDPSLAAYLNENFVCVKVDRDERPDVDSRYQRAVQALTGQGGWPLTAFLTESGDPFYGGTYFPPDGRFGRPGFRSVLERVREIFTQQRDKVEATATELRGHVAQALSESSPGTPSAEVLSSGAEQMARLFDWRYGGFGTAPKFPHPSACEFLLARWWDTGAPWLREVVERTLSGMARGGMYDQIGGGFHRYSVDERWCVPHFEKMSYDNAELLRCYLHAWAAWRTPLFREIAEGIVAWNFEVMTDAARGGFAASQDADVGLDDDGDYFTWTAEEARAVLDEREWDVAHRLWDIYQNGEMHHNPQKNVLWVARSAEALSSELDVGPSAVRDLIESARAKLKAARSARKTPFVDRSIYVSWNAMMADAFLEAGAILGRNDCTRYALKTLELLWAEGFVPGRGMVHRVPTHDARRPTHDPSHGPWLLDDQVQSAAAFLTAFEHTGDGKWLDRARELTDMMLAFYWDDKEGGFFDAREVSEGFLSARGKPIQDAPTSSPNAVAALVLLRLSIAADEPKFRERAEKLLAAFAGRASELSIHGATYLRALDWLISGECKIVVADTTTSDSLAAPGLAAYRPRKIVIQVSGTPVPGTPAPVALICAGMSCAAPVKTPETLLATLESFARPK